MTQIYVILKIYLPCKESSNILFFQGKSQMAYSIHSQHQTQKLASKPRSTVKSPQLSTHYYPTLQRSNYPLSTQLSPKKLSSKNFKQEIALNDRQNAFLLNALKKYKVDQQLKKNNQSNISIRKQNTDQLSIDYPLKQVGNLNKQLFSPTSFKQISKQSHSHCIDVLLQKVDIDQKSQSLCLFLNNEILKMNQHILKMQAIFSINTSNVSQKNKMHGIVNHVNSLILLINFILNKLSYKEQQIKLSCQQIETINSQFRVEYHSLQNQYQTLLQKVEKKIKKEDQLRNQASRMRQVIESFQIQNYQLRKQVHLLNEVIKQMNIQVQKVQKRLSDKRKQHSALEQDYNKVSGFAQQLQKQLKRNVEIIGKYDQSNQEVETLQKEIQKWKSRCFELQDQMKNEKRKDRICP